MADGRCKVFLRFVDDQGYTYDIVGEADSIECVRETMHTSRGSTTRQLRWFTNPYIDIHDLRRSMKGAVVNWEIAPEKVQGDYPQGPPLDASHSR